MGASWRAHTFPWKFKVSVPTICPPMFSLGLGTRGRNRLNLQGPCGIEKKNPETLEACSLRQDARIRKGTGGSEITGGWAAHWTVPSLHLTVLLEHALTGATTWAPPFGFSLFICLCLLFGFLLPLSLTLPPCLVLSVCLSLPGISSPCAQVPGRNTHCIRGSRSGRPPSPPIQPLRDPGLHRGNYDGFGAPRLMPGQP